MTVSPPPASGKFLRIERDGSPGRCGARRSGRGSFERVVRVRSVGGDGDGARKSLGTACAPDSAQRVDVASVQKPHILFLPGKWPRISTLTSLTRIRNLAFSLTVNNRWADARTVRDWTAIRDCSSPGRRLVRNGRFAPICSAFSNGGLSLHRTSQRNTHTRSHGNARVVTSDGVER